HHEDLAVAHDGGAHGEVGTLGIGSCVRHGMLQQKWSRSLSQAKPRQSPLVLRSINATRSVCCPPPSRNAFALAALLVARGPCLTTTPTRLASLATLPTRGRVKTEFAARLSPSD